jgi:hypothetical protein
MLDVGGGLGPGILDQHQDGKLGASASELLVKFPDFCYGHLMDDWLRRRDDGQDLRRRAFSPVIVLHADPDFDSLVACHLAKRLIEDGELPAYADALAQYTSRVDQGKFGLDLKYPHLAEYPIHMGYLALQNLPGAGPPAVSAQRLIEAGESLLGVALTAMAKSLGGPWKLRAAHFEPVAGLSEGPEGVSGQQALPACAAWRDDPAFAPAVALLAADFDAYKADKHRAILYGHGEVRAAIELPLQSGAATTFEAKAFVLLEPPRSKLNKYWVRADGYAYFVCPYHQERDVNVPSADYQPPQKYGRVILSVDPNWRDPLTGQQLSLRGLGRALELAECAVRASGDNRAKVPRWDDGTVTNADPWYDGRGHDYTIVDSPLSATALPYEDVCKIATGKFFHIQLAAAEIFMVQPGLVEPTAAPSVAAGNLAIPEEIRSSLHSLYADWGPASADAVPAGPPTAGRSSWQKLAERGFKVDAGARRPPKCLTAAGGQAVSPVLMTTHATWSANAAQSEPGVTLDELVEWVEREDAASGHRAYVVANVELAEGHMGGAQVDALLERLCLGKVLRAGSEEVGNLVVFNGRAVAVRPVQGRSQARASGHLLRELLTYAAFQAETLAGFTAAIAKGVEPESLEFKTLAALRKQFVAFQAKYVVLEPVRDADARMIFKGISDALGLEAQHAKLNVEIDRLEQFSRDRADELRQVTEDKMNLLLFFVGLTGVVEASMSDWDKADVNHWSVLGICLLLAVFWFVRIQDQATRAAARYGQGGRA